MSSSQRKQLRSPEVVSAGCSCRNPSIPGRFVVKKPKPSPVNSAIVPLSASSSSQERLPSTDGVSSSSIVSSSSSVLGIRTRSEESTSSCELPVSLGSAVAVVKASDNPYRDFRNSAVQMILENEIYGREGLQELLRCLLSLNSADHHGVILRAFAEAVDETSRRSTVQHSSK